MSTATPTDTGAPRVWLGCLGCYNDGALVGRWVDCADVEDVTLADLYAGSGRPYAACEEVWVLDPRVRARRGRVRASGGRSVGPVL